MRFRLKRLQIASVFLAAAAMVILSLASFAPPPRNPDPSMVTYEDKNAVQGWREAEDHYCMGCHTILGNGAYFGPDLTKVYDELGPAWLKAFLSHPDRFPTEGDVEQNLPTGMTLEQYYEMWPTASSEAADVGGRETNMPPLDFDEGAKDALIAWIDYLSQINTNDWPPSEENNYSFSDSYDQNLGRWPESFDAWVGYWIFALVLTIVIMFTFFHRLGARD